MLLAHDDNMGPSDAPGQLQKYTEPEVTEKYSKLKKRYNQLEEKHNELLDELQRASERNLKMKEERNILLDRIIELEAGNKLPQAIQSAFPRTLVRQRSQAAFMANLARAETELSMEPEGSDIRDTSRHLGAIAEAHHRADVDRQLAWEEELEREARREAKKRRNRSIELNGRRPRINWYAHDGEESPLAPRDDWIVNSHTRLGHDSAFPGPRDASRRLSVPGLGEMNGSRAKRGWNIHDAMSRLDDFGFDKMRITPRAGIGYSDSAGRRRKAERYPYESDGLPPTAREEYPVNGHSKVWADPPHVAVRAASPAPSVPGPDTTPLIDAHIDPSLTTAIIPRSTTPPDSPRYPPPPLYKSRNTPPYPRPIPPPVYHGGPTPTPVAYAPMIHYEPPSASSSKPRQAGPPILPDEPKGPKQKRARTHAAASKPIPIPVIPRDSSLRPILPLAVGMLTLISLGEVCTRDHFHTERYIYPVGYEVTKRYQSTIDPRSEVLYHCSIHDGGDGPKFQIIPADRPDEPVIAGTATGAWSRIVKQANAIRNRNHSNSVSGPEFFGLGQNTIRHLIQDLPGARELRDYARQVFVEGGQMGTSHDPHKLGSGPDSAPPTQPYPPTHSPDRPLTTLPLSTVSDHTPRPYIFKHSSHSSTSMQLNSQSAHTPRRSIVSAASRPLHIQQYWPAGVSPHVQSPREESSRPPKPLTFVAPLRPS